MPSVAVVSHPHFDHLHLPSLRKLSPEVRIVAPVGTARALARAAPAISRRVEEVAPGEAVDVDGVVIRAVRAAHDDRRSPLSHYRAPPLGFIIEAGSENPMRVWFAGDTRLFTEMSDFRPVDVAVIPIGGWGPPLGPTHPRPNPGSRSGGPGRGKGRCPSPLWDLLATWAPLHQPAQLPPTFRRGRAPVRSSPCDVLPDVNCPPAQDREHRYRP